jgi:hypothetical protein
MKLEILVFGITSFLLYNTYYDNIYSKLLITYKKHLKLFFIAIVGIILYTLLKRDPSSNKVLLSNANNIIKYMPIDKSSIDIISPILDFTGNNNFMRKYNNAGQNTTETNQIRTSGNNNISHNTDGSVNYKRSVSNIKKKMVAAKQKWKCAQCKELLSAHYEIDHITALHKGGSNNIDNLISLCRECHANKTAQDYL